jgi:hypothetical protein
LGLESPLCKPILSGFDTSLGLETTRFTCEEAEGERERFRTGEKGDKMEVICWGVAGRGLPCDEFCPGFNRVSGKTTLEVFFVFVFVFLQYWV